MRRLTDIREYDKLHPDPGQERKTKVVWPCLNVFWSAQTDLESTMKGNMKTIFKSGLGLILLN